MSVETPESISLSLGLDNNKEVENVVKLVQNRLVQSGWNEQVRLACRSILKETDKPISADKLISMVTPKARSLVPDSVKKELLHELEKILTEQSLEVT